MCRMALCMVLSTSDFLYVKKVPVRVAYLHETPSISALPLCRELPIWDLLNPRPGEGSF